jgi:hypothetical protein
VTTLASGPEHAGEHENRAGHVANAAHAAILEVAVAPSRLHEQPKSLAQRS